MKLRISLWAIVCMSIAMLLCAGSSAFAQNNTIFGPNVYVFTPSNSVSSINSTLNTLNTNTQFDTKRYAVLFTPGTYTGVEAETGYYESIAGLGVTPSAVQISNGYLNSNQTDSNGNVTTNFWRSLENMQITVPSGTTYQWGVSQGAAFRRMDIESAMELANTSCGYASGGFISNSKVTGEINACSQQQWYTRNSDLAGGWEGFVWNFVFSGVKGAPGQSNPFTPNTKNGADTTLATTPVSREKPYLYVDSSSNYNVFVPTLLTNSSNTDWTANGGLGTGYSMPISDFLIATPSTSLGTINAALAAGQSLILTPGIYQYSGAINVVNPNTIVLGLGYATLVPQAGTAAITVADVDGVQIAGLLIDAGPVNSPVLMQVGALGATRVSHATNPTSLNDVFFSIGGAFVGTATTALEIDSDNVILDNIWAWRADHGTDAYWTGNIAMHGLVVNGDNVTALGLAIEHFEEEQVVWNGEGGETIFYQSEMPYDVPSESAWSDNGVDGYASYNVAPTVTSHKGYGLGVYSYFDQGVDIIANSGIAAPVAAGVTFTDLVTVWLNGSGSITYTIASNNGITDNAGTLAHSGATISAVGSWGGSGSSCSGVPTAPGAPAGTGASDSSIALTWTASTAGSGCTISYTIYRSATSGFTPSASNEVVNGVNAATYTDAGLVPAATYYYIIEAVDDAGSSAFSAQGSGTTLANSCTTAPAAVAGLTPTAASSSAIDLSWTSDKLPSKCTIMTYTIYGGTSPNPTTVLSSNQTGNHFSNTGLTPSTTYYYTVVASDEFAAAPASAVVSTTTLAGTSTCSSAPAAPTGVTPVANSSTSVTVSWNAVTPPANCSVSYTVNGAAVSGTSVTYTGLTPSTAYSYTVAAADSVGSTAAAPVSITTPAAPVCSAAPAAPTGVTPVANSSTSITVSWNAVTPPANCSVSYTVNGAAVAGTSVTYTGLTPSTPYSYTVTAADSFGSTAAAPVSITTPPATCGAVTVAPTGLAVTTTTSSSVSLSWSAVTPPANCTVSSYAVFGGTTANPTAQVGTATGTTFTNTGLAASTTYYYVVKAIDGFGTSAASVQVSGLTLPNTTGPDFIAIAAGGPAESNATGGDASFIADKYYSGGGDNSHTTKTINLTQPGANAAPMGVYQYGRAGVTTYTIPGMVVGSSHTVLLHFSENYYSAKGKRVFNVAINGASALADFDIYAAAGAEYTAVVETFTATANSAGDIVIAFTKGTADQPLIDGIEIR